jgi:hypothetical protein
MKILGERLYSPPKMLYFQAKEPLSDEPLESLNRAPKEQIGILLMNLSGKRTESVRSAIFGGQFTIVFWPLSFWQPQRNFSNYSRDKRRY